MTEKQRLITVMDHGIPDKVPHFELVFQIPEQAFGMSWPTEREVQAAGGKDLDLLYNRFFEINEKIIDSYHWSAIAVPVDFFGRKKDMITEAKKRLGKDVLIYDWNGNGTFWLMDGNDMMDFSVRLFEDPSDVHREARFKCEQAKRLAEIQVDQGADFICINSDFAYNRGPFISPAMFAEFITPYLCEVVDKIHSLGVKAMLHSDGDLRKILDQLVSTGIDGLQSIDPQGNMDLSEVKRLYGDRLFLMGNVHTAMMQSENEEQIRTNVRQSIAVGKPGGGYILSTSNCIFNGMPLGSYRIMLDEYEKNAWY